MPQRPLSTQQKTSTSVSKKPVDQSEPKEETSVPEKHNFPSLSHEKKRDKSNSFELDSDSSIIVNSFRLSRCNRF